ncbi:MAG: thioredoxin domain-containing protein [Halopseudomonas aestusnigri]|nr:thioredoxin domain-containing protein [Halopseudomonas aestusnigri]
MAENSLLPTIAITALSTALAVTWYWNHNRVSALEEQIQTINTVALGLDEASIAQRAASEAPAITVPEATAGQSSQSEHGDQWLYGNQRARFTLVELTDTECPYCRTHFPALKSLVEASGGNVNAAIVHVPVQGEASRRQAIAVECAGDQGGSEAAWEMMSTILASTRGHGEGIQQPTPILAKDMGLDQQRFIACTESNEVIDRITSDLDAAVKLGIAQTPSTLVYDNQSGQSILLQGDYASPTGITDAIEQLVTSSGSNQ